MSKEKFSQFKSTLKEYDLIISLWIAFEMVILNIPTAETPNRNLALSKPTPCLI
jgi:hypothetical protein